MTLPYKTPDNDLTLNIAILLLIIGILGKSTRGKLLLNNERLRLAFYLLKNPTRLNEILAINNKPSVKLQIHDEYSVASISHNADALYDDHSTKVLLQYAAASNFIEVDYRKTDGFMYSLSLAGSELIDRLEGEYYDHLRSCAQALSRLNTVPTSSLNEQADHNRRR